MIEYYLGSHCIQQLIKTLCRKPLEERIRITLASDSVDNLISLKILINHFAHSCNIILTIAIYGNGNITFVSRIHQTSQYYILMSAVSALGYSNKMFISLSQIRNNLPCFIL